MWAKLKSNVLWILIINVIPSQYHLRNSFFWKYLLIIQLIGVFYRANIGCSPTLNPEATLHVTPDTLPHRFMLNIQIKGPPLSPWHESLSLSEAQRWCWRKINFHMQSHSLNMKWKQKSVRSQFHQHFLRAFFLRKSFWQLCSSYVLAKKHFCTKICTKNVDEIDTRLCLLSYLSLCDLLKWSTSLQ
jgi:hypothetical protein